METITKALAESQRMTNRKPVAQQLTGVMSVLNEIAAMATDHRHYEEIAAETGRLNQIVSQVELIVGFLEANKPTEQQQKPSPQPPPPPEPNFTDTDRADVLLRTLKLIALDISDYPLLAQGRPFAGRNPRGEAWEFASRSLRNLRIALCCDDDAGVGTFVFVDHFPFALSLNHFSGRPIM